MSPSRTAAQGPATRFSVLPALFNEKLWLTRTLMYAAIGAILFGGVNYELDFFGLYGDARGLSRAVYADGSMYNLEQDAKYLLALNYIPANFDGLLIGCSSTFNWDTSRLDAARIYNLSMGGTNISEETLVAKSALRKGKFRIVLFSVFPYLTESHGVRAGRMVPRLYWEGLGSLRLFYSYKRFLALSVHHEPPFISDFGVHRYAPGTRSRKQWIEGRLSYRRGPIYIDPIAFKEYGDLVASARAAGARIVRLRQPLYYEHWRANEAEYLNYERRMDTLFVPGDPVIDCNRPAYDSIRRNRANYYDSYHMLDAAARELMTQINEDLRSAIGKQ